MVDICGFCVSASVASALVASDCVLSVPSAVLSTALSSAFPASDVSLTTSTPFRLAASFILSPIYSFPMSAPAIMTHKTKSTDNRIFNPLFFIVLLICNLILCYIILLCYYSGIPRHNNRLYSKNHTIRISTVCALAPIRSALSHVER